jgi:hypothetical protein
MNKKKKNRFEPKVNFTLFEDRFDSNNVFIKRKNMKLGDFKKWFKEVESKWL